MIIMGYFIWIAFFEIDFWGNNPGVSRRINVSERVIAYLKRSEMCQPKLQVQGGFLFCPDRIHLGEKTNYSV